MSGQETTLFGGSQDQLQSMLTYYRQKLDQYERERREWQEQSEHMRILLEKVHTNELEVINKKNEISELQKELSDSHLAIYDERQMLMRLKRDFEQLHKNDHQDKRRIKELLSLNEDIENSSLAHNNYKDCRPDSMRENTMSNFSNSTIAESQFGKQASRSKKENLAITKSAQEQQKEKGQYFDKYNRHVSQVNNRKKTVTHCGGIVQTYGKAAASFQNQPIMGNFGNTTSQGGVVKTVILPNEEVNRLGVEVEELKCFMNAQTVMFEEAIKAFEKDKNIRMQEFQLKTNDHNDKVRDLESRLNQRKDVNYDLSKQYFEYKYELGNHKSQLQDQLDLQKIENAQLKAHFDAIFNDQAHDTKFTQQQYSKKSDTFAARFRKQTKENDEDLNIVKVQYEGVQKKYLQDLQELEKQLDDVQQKGKLVGNRRETEGSAFQGDIQTLQKKVKEMEKELKKLKSLVDEEKTDELVDQLQHLDGKQNLSQEELEALVEEITKVQKEVSEARKFKINSQD